MKCTLCNSGNTVIKSEKIDDFFDGELFIYDEFYTECCDCGFEFVSAEQSTLNLKSRFAGKVTECPVTHYVNHQNLCREIGESMPKYKWNYGLDSLDIENHYLLSRNSHQIQRIFSGVAAIPASEYNPCYILRV